MTKRKYRISVALMGFSLALLILLQVFWLRTEYHSAAATFDRETNLIFRTTVNTISDSLFFNHLRVLVKTGAFEVDTFFSDGAAHDGLSVTHIGRRFSSPMIIRKNRGDAGGDEIHS